MAHFIKGLYLIAALMLASCLAAALAQQHPKRLILKDGSYQTVSKWEIVGDRVRYLSAERYAWEEVPSILVDWMATEKYNNDLDSEHAAATLHVAAIDEAKNAEAPTVAPGLRLPDGGGVFLLETYQNQPQLVELTQNAGDLNKHTGRNIMRAAVNPLSLSSKQTLELEGEHAKVQSHVTRPDLYVNVPPDASPESGVPANAPAAGAGPTDRFAIARLEKKKDLRVAANVTVSVSGKIRQKGNWIKTVATPMGDWVKITPVEPLTTGEYAVIELLDKGQINLYVWDFGVNPSAPANSFVWTARQPDAGQPGTDANPNLEKRPK